MKIYIILLAFLALAGAQMFVDQSDYKNTVDDLSITDTEISSKWLHVLSDPKYEGYSVRVRRIYRPNFCDDVVQYSGYFDDEKNDAHFFFWFFESRFEPKYDPVVLWLNGGPGCSSLTGLWMELGPCLITSEVGNETVLNEHSWNSYANVFFLDQPLNVGFSHGAKDVRSTTEAAKDVWIFLQLFFKEFKRYSRLPFHIAGESYAGHYIPAIASEIIERNSDLSSGAVHINLESLLIGNGWTDPINQYPTYPKYARENDILEESAIVAMENAVPRCLSLSRICYRNPRNPFACVPAGLYCNRAIHSPYMNTGKNPYDIRRPCSGENGLCYEILDGIEIWANRKDVRAELGVDDEVKEYKSCSTDINQRFFLDGDFAKPFSNGISNALESGVRVLIYAGDKDWVCQWMGNKAWTLELEWSGQEEYVNAKDETWFSWINLEEAGEFRSSGNLTFLRVFDAGHMVPYDQPGNSLDFMSKWLHSISFSFKAPK